jgi:hypothetical protein
METTAQTAAYGPARLLSGFKRSFVVEAFNQREEPAGKRVQEERRTREEWADLSRGWVVYFAATAGFRSGSGLS